MNAITKMLGNGQRCFFPVEEGIDLELLAESLRYLIVEECEVTVCSDGISISNMARFEVLRAKIVFAISLIETSAKVALDKNGASAV